MSCRPILTPATVIVRGEYLHAGTRLPDILPAYYRWINACLYEVCAGIPKAEFERVFIHQSYHRGQVMMLRSQNGFEWGSTDWLWLSDMETAAGVSPCIP